jgi:cell division septal protein FtsQ
LAVEPDPQRRHRPRRPPVISPAHIARLVRTGIILGLAVAIVWGLVGAYQAFAGSRLFALRRVEVLGAVRAAPEEIKRAVRQAVSGSLWQVDLDELRREVEGQAWVREAEVVRVLPDTLRVAIAEREPFALQRRANGSLIWVDREGVAVGSRALFKTEAVPPLISGLEEGEGEAAGAANRRKLIVYQQLLAELDGGPARLSEVVDEVNLGDLQDVRLRLASRRLTVMVGERDFRPRLEAALKVLRAIERQDLAALGLLKVTDAERLLRGGRIAYLNATRPDRVIVGLAQ